MITLAIVMVSVTLSSHLAYCDELIIFRDGPFFTGSDSNSVALVLENPEPRQALQVTITYDHEQLIFHGATAAGRLLPSIETISSEDGAGVVRILVFDEDATALPIEAGSTQVVDLRFTLTLSAIPDSETPIGVSAALAASNDATPVLIDSIAFTSAIIPIMVGIDDGFGQPPAPSVLFQNSPNPFNPSTTIRFNVGRKERVRLRVYDVAGRLVCRLLDDMLEPGPQAVTWSGRDGQDRRMASGVYFYRLDVGAYSAVKKMALLK